MNQSPATKLLEDIRSQSWAQFDDYYEDIIYSSYIGNEAPDISPEENLVYLAATYLETRIRHRDRFQELVYILMPHMHAEWSVTKRLNALIPIYNQTQISGFSQCISEMIPRLAESVNTEDYLFSREQKQKMALNVFAESVVFAYGKLRGIGQQKLFSNEILPKVLIKLSNPEISYNLGLLGEYMELCSSVDALTDYRYPWKPL